MMKSAGIAVMPSIGPRQPDGNRWGAMRHVHVPIYRGLGFAALAIAEKAQHRFIKWAGTAEIGYSEVDVMNPPAHGLTPDGRAWTECASSPRELYAFD